MQRLCLPWDMVCSRDSEKIWSPGIWARREYGIVATKKGVFQEDGRMRIVNITEPRERWKNYEFSKDFWLPVKEFF